MGLASLSGLPGMTRRHVEAEHQRALFTWARLAERRIPELRWLFHVPNGERRDARTGAMLKAMGVRPGVPDVWLPIRRGGHIGLVIEMKAPGGAKTRPSQQEWIDHLRREGWVAGACYGWQQARLSICTYLDVKP